MPEAAENYTSIDMHERFRTQALWVWAVLLTIAFVWVLLILLAPAFAANSFEVAADAIYRFFGFICHQKPERSFFVLGHQFAVCSRCFGVYFGILLGVAVYPLWRNVDDVEPLPKIWLFLSMVPIGVDWLVGMLEIWENTFASRFITGMILGFACATYIIPAAVEIARNLAKKRASNIR